jgi:DNA-binding IclR family transcriptional regulator
MDTTRRILTLITDHLETGHPMTVRTLATHLHCSVGTAQALTIGLIHRGLLTRQGTPPTLTPTDEGLILIHRI